MVGISALSSFQCSDTIGWVRGRASSLHKPAAIITKCTDLGNLRDVAQPQATPEEKVAPTITVCCGW